MPVEGPPRERSHRSSTDPEHANPRPQQRVGPYRLAERLGEGGMGVVHLGIDERGRAVAVKVLRDHVAHDPSARTRLAREFDTLRRVRHDRVAPVLDVDIDGDHPYLVTRYVPGPPLDVWVRDQGPLSRDGLLRLGRGLAEALDAIHQAGVVHRDLKPGNVLMLDGDPVVIDFGIAHVADDVRLTSTGLVMGTPGYLPPELLDGADVGEATDWWGWAATLAYAGTGRDPFGKGPLDAVFHRVYRGDADLRGIDPALASLLGQALDPDPRARPGFGDVLGRLEDLKLGRGAAAPNPKTRPVNAAAESTAAVSTAAVSTAAAGAAKPGLSDIDDRPDRTLTMPRVPQGVARRAHPGAANDPTTRPQPVIATRTMPQVPASSERQAPGWQYAGFREAEPAAGSGPGQYGAPPRATGTWPDGGPMGLAGPGEGDDPLEQIRQVGHGASAVAAPLDPIRRPRSVAPAVVALLAALVALAASLPVLAVFLAAGWSVLARSLNSSTLAVAMRREMRGRRVSDVPRAVMFWPFRLIPATLTTVLVVAFTGIAAVLAALATAAIQATTYGSANGPLGDLPLAVGMFVGVLLGWIGPAGTSLRRGSRIVMRSVAPGRWGILVVSVVLWLAAAYFALRSQATGIGAETWPLPEGLLSTFQFGF